MLMMPITAGLSINNILPLQFKVKILRFKLFLAIIRIIPSKIY